MKAYDYHGYKYCQDCAAVLDDAIIADGEEIIEADFPGFTPCDECKYDIFGREAEDMELRRDNKTKFICPYCRREFPMWYWGVSGRAGGYGTRRITGLAMANFHRHKLACKESDRGG